ncbi:cytochrome P450 [Streptosporangium canum]|uniref:cytochrome P450 n=1 Tax=Streptosporangium canum TaxID=324952 RepID=UPI0037B878AE
MDYNPFDHTLQENPYPTYARLRDEAPLYRNETLDFWALSRHGDVNAAFRNHSLFSSSRGVSLEMWDVAETWGLQPTALVGFLAMDPPQHSRMRALVSRGFSPSRVGGLEPAVRAVARRYLAEAFETGTFDFAAVLRIIPMDVISELLGVPHQDRAEVLRHLEILIGRYDGDTELPDTFWRATEALTTYYTALIAERRARPRVDLISALVAADIDGDRLSDQEIVGVVTLLNSAGNETVTKLAGAAWYQAWRHPDQRAMAWAGNITGWIEETSRYDGPAQTMARQLTRDTVLYDTLIPAGARVLLLGAAANRDERVFPLPDRYDLTRDTTQMLLRLKGGGYDEVRLLTADGVFAMPEV